MIKVINIVGARPNFMKMAPIQRHMQQSEKIQPFLVHTGQHYDEKMSKTFFVDLGMPEPDVYLGVGSGSHAVQTANVMVEIEKLLIAQKPDLLVVVGDVNSTIASSLAAVKLNIPVAHVEAGLRSFDRKMPEEINRILTDSISDFLFVTEQSGLDNLKEENVPDSKVHFVGNVMIDSLVDHLEKASHETILDELKISPKEYALMTLHRPSNVDNKNVLDGILGAVETIQNDMPIIFPIHPRTKKMVEQFGFDDRLKNMSNLILTEPLGYLPFLRLTSQAKLVLTDSGGIQEETTYLKIPCITLRENTERPSTCTLGTNQLVGMEPAAILDGYKKSQNLGDTTVPPLWDGKASQRIVEIIENI